MLPLLPQLRWVWLPPLCLFTLLPVASNKATPTDSGASSYAASSSAVSTSSTHPLFLYTPIPNSFSCSILALLTWARSGKGASELQRIGTALNTPLPLQPAAPLPWQSAAPPKKMIGKAASKVPAPTKGQSEHAPSPGTRKTGGGGRHWMQTLGWFRPFARDTTSPLRLLPSSFQVTGRARGCLLCFNRRWQRCPVVCHQSLSNRFCSR